MFWPQIDWLIKISPVFMKDEKILVYFNKKPDIPSPIRGILDHYQESLTTNRKFQII